MSTNSFKYNYTFKGLIFGILISIPVIVLGGGGHGWTEPLFIVFPFVILVGQAFPNASIDVLLFSLVLLQFPLYGFLLDYFKSKKIMLPLILIVHVILVSIAFIFFKE